MRVCQFRKHTVAQHAHFHSSVLSPVHIINQDEDTQDEFDRLYNSMSVLLDVFYPERTVNVTPGDPPYVTPAVKRMMRRKSKLMRLGQYEEAAPLVVKIVAAIKNFSSAELSRSTCCQIVVVCGRKYGS